MPRLLFTFGTRPEAIKMAPLVRQAHLQQGAEPIVCLTGQHQEMVSEILRVFNLVSDYDLEIARSGQGLNEVVSQVIGRMDELIRVTKPDWVVVQGDTATSFAAAVAAYLSQVPVAHVEAGLRSHSLQHPWPEEANRRMTSIVAQRHYAPTDSARDELLSEGIDPDSVIVTGNTVIDALLWAARKLDRNRALTNQFDTEMGYLDPERRLILVTGHRRESFGERLAGICTALARLAARPDVQIVYPVHLNPNVRGPVFRLLAGFSSVHLIEPLDYLRFVHLMRRADFILTDSGGIQEEAPALKKPVLVMRDTTERAEAIETGVARLVTTDPDRIVAEAVRLLESRPAYDQMAAGGSPYGDGRAAERIISDLIAASQPQPARERAA